MCLQHFKPGVVLLVLLVFFGIGSAFGADETISGTETRNGTSVSGKLTVDPDATLNLNAAADGQKFDATGVQSGSGTFDAFFGNGFTVADRTATENGGTIYTTGSSSVKIAVGGESKIGGNFGGILNPATFSADNLTFVGVHPQTGISTSKRIDNDGTVNVGGTLSLDNIVFYNNPLPTSGFGTVNATQLDLSNCSSFYNKAGTAAYGTLNIGTIDSLGYYTNSGNGTTQVNTLNIYNGVLNLEGTTTNGGLVMSGVDSKINVANTGKIDAGMLTLNFTLPGTTIKNDGIIIGDLHFAQGKYSGTGQVFGSMSYTEGTALDPGAGITTTLQSASGRTSTLIMENDSTLVIGFDGTPNGPRSTKIKVYETDLQIGTDVQLNHLSALGKGTHDFSIIESEQPSQYNSDDLDLVYNPLWGTASLSEGTTVHPGTPEQTSDDLKLQYTMNRNLQDFARTQNQAATARNIDAVRTGMVTQNQRAMFDAIFDATNDSQIRAALSELSASARANSLMIGMSRPWDITFERMNLRAPDAGYGSPRWRKTSLNYGSIERDTTAFAPGMQAEVPSLEETDRPVEEPTMLQEELEELNPNESISDITSRYFGQCPSVGGINFWVSPYHTEMEVGSDANSQGFDISRTGFLFGGHRSVGKHGALGMIFGYSDPVLNQYNNRITANDYQVGFYGGVLLKHKYELKGYLGFGHQQYTTRRWASMGGLSDRVNGRTDGESFAMSFQLARPIRDWNCALWRPLIALDLNNANQSGFSESGDAIAYRFSDASLTKCFFRVGLGREMDFRNLRLRGALSYSTQIGGQTAAGSTGRFIGTGGPGATEYGVGIGRDFINGNVGAEYFLDRSKTSSFFGDYNVHASNKETDQTASLGFRWMM